jgi:hypothetical protein
LKVRTINQTNINRMRNAFMEYLLDNGVIMSEIGLFEEEDKLILVFKLKDNLSVFKFEKEKCIGHEIDLIVQEIINPMLPQLKPTNG